MRQWQCEFIGRDQHDRRIARQKPRRSRRTTARTHLKRDPIPRLLALIAPGQVPERHQMGSDQHGQRHVAQAAPADQRDRARAGQDHRRRDADQRASQEDRLDRHADQIVEQHRQHRQHGNHQPDPPALPAPQQPQAASGQQHPWPERLEHAQRHHEAQFIDDAPGWLGPLDPEVRRNPLGLLDQGRQVRQPQHRHRDRDHGESPERQPSGPVEQVQRDEDGAGAGDHQHRRIVRPQSDQRARTAQPPATPPVTTARGDPHRAVQQQRSTETQQRIGPRLTRELDLERRQREHEAGHDTDERRDQSAGQHHDQRRAHAQKGRQRPQCFGLVTEYRDPGFQQQKVQRRVRIALRNQVPQIGQALTGVPPGVALVEPQRLVADTVETHHGGQGQNRCDRQPLPPVHPGRRTGRHATRAVLLASFPAHSVIQAPHRTWPTTMPPEGCGQYATRAPAPGRIPGRRCARLLRPPDPPAARGTAPPEIPRS